MALRAREAFCPHRLKRSDRPNDYEPDHTTKPYELLRDTRHRVHPPRGDYSGGGGGDGGAGAVGGASLSTCTSLS